jgi:hypothetical protein
MDGSSVKRHTAFNTWPCSRTHCKFTEQLCAGDKKTARNCHQRTLIKCLNFYRCTEVCDRQPKTASWQHCVRGGMLPACGISLVWIMHDILAADCLPHLMIGCLRRCFIPRYDEPPNNHFRNAGCGYYRRGRQSVSVCCCCCCYCCRCGRSRAHRCPHWRQLQHGTARRGLNVRTRSRMDQGRTHDSLNGREKNIGTDSV